jgi:hypothetical protein
MTLSPDTINELHAIADEAEADGVPHVAEPLRRAAAALQEALDVYTKLATGEA